VIKAVSLALKTVTVANPKGFLEVESTSLPLMVPWADNFVSEISKTIKRVVVLLIGLV
jgi:hypothetical protein